MAKMQLHESPVSEAAGKILNRKLLKWVEEVSAACTPDRMCICAMDRKKNTS